MKKRYAIILILIILYAMNPTTSDFVEWSKDNVKQHYENVAVDFFTELLSGGFKAITQRDNYFICSVYKIQYGNKEYEFLGVFKTFIPIKY